MIACESVDDAIDLVDIWGEDYTVFEVPYMVAKTSTTIPGWFPYEGTPKSPNVEPMPFINKPITVNKGIEPTPVVTCNEKNSFLPKVPMDEVGMM